MQVKSKHLLANFHHHSCPLAGDAIIGIRSDYRFETNFTTLSSWPTWRLHVSIRVPFKTCKRGVFTHPPAPPQAASPRGRVYIRRSALTWPNLYTCAHVSEFSSFFYVFTTRLVRGTRAIDRDGARHNITICVSGVRSSTRNKNNNDSNNNKLHANVS